jgi:hypothetical protein
MPQLLLAAPAAQEWLHQFQVHLLLMLAVAVVVVRTVIPGARVAPGAVVPENQVRQQVPVELAQSILDLVAVAVVLLQQLAQVETVVLE